jgi:hypothetical protein
MSVLRIIKETRFSNATLEKKEPQKEEEQGALQ